MSVRIFLLVRAAPKPALKGASMGATELIVAGFDSFHRAEQVMDELKVMDREDLVSILNAVVVKKDAQGNVTSSDDGDVRPANGALFGALVGAIIGFIGGPGGMVVGAAAGAITGGVTAAGIDMGFSDHTIDELQKSLPISSSAIFALVEEEHSEQLITEIENRRGRIIRQSMREEFTNRLRTENTKDTNRDNEKYSL
jgi:uncharacterized membrane protein